MAASICARADAAISGAIGSGAAKVNYVAQFHLPFATQDTGCLQDSIPVNTVYYDGLGRQIQSFTGVAGGSHSGVADYTEYDSNGRVRCQWLAGPSADKTCGFTPLSSLKALYDEPDYAFALTKYEMRVSGRPVQTFAPGKAWHTAAHGKTTAYTYNNAMGGMNSCDDLRIESGNIRRYRALPSNTLSLTIAIDEDNEQTLEFKDARGLTRLIRTVSMQGNQKETYFLYDKLDRLVAVIPPAASQMIKYGSPVSLTDKRLTDLCYLYEYDALGRVFRKNIPGSGYRYSILTQCGKPAFTTDALLLRENKTRWYLYDGLGRLVCSGISKDNDPDRFSTADYECPGACTRFDAEEGTLMGYVPVSGIEKRKDLLTADYYDNYRFLSMLNPAQADSLAYDPSENNDYVDEQYIPKGHRTGSLRKALGKDGARQYVISAYYYDSKGRLVQTRTLNHLGGIDICGGTLSFDGRPLHSYARHESPDTSMYVERRYRYLADLKPAGVDMRINGGAWTRLTENRYDALRRIDRVSMLDAEIRVAYGYTAQGRLRTLSSEPFSQTLYRETRYDGSHGYLSGDISAQEFMLSATTPDASSAQGKSLHAVYNYRYNGHRLEEAKYSEIERSGQPVSTSELPTVHVNPDYTADYKYDFAGNPVSVKRRGVTEISLDCVTGDNGKNVYREVYSYGLIDDLTLTYDGNRLKKVSDSAEDPDYAGATDFRDGADEDTEYEYDTLGRMTKDRNKGITSIAYNEIGLPSDVYISGAHIRYTYDADGTLLCKSYGNDVIVSRPGSDWGVQASMVFESNSRRDYVGPIEYCDGAFERMHHECGWLGADGRHTVAVRDWQGSVRATWRQGEYARVQGPPQLFRGRPRLYRNVTGYYPYGIAFADWRGEERYGYGGKEQDRTCGLELHDFHARQYDAQTCRFTSIDPLAEQYAANSPYVYCLSNPVAYTDPSGMTIKAQAGDGSGRFGLDYDRHKSTEDCFTTEVCAGYSSEDIAYVRTAFEALDYLYTSPHGKEIIEYLMASSYEIIIRPPNNGKNQYSPGSGVLSYGHLEEMRVCGRYKEKAGCGGIVYWSPDDDVCEFANNKKRPSAIGMAHELGHAYDAAQGKMYPSFETECYTPYYHGIYKSEWNAVYHENIIRMQLGIPLRHYYYQQENENGFFNNSGYKMTKQNQPMDYEPFSSSKPQRIK